LTLPSVSEPTETSVATSWLRAGLQALSILAVVVALVVRPDRVVVEEVAFFDNERATAAELRHLANISNGTTIWGVDLQEVSEGVASHPWVRRAVAVRRYPASVHVQVHEYTPVALLAFDGALYYVDSFGTAFLRASSDDLDYPVITGIQASLEAAHPHLPRLALGEALWLLGEVDREGLIDRELISEIEFSRTRGFTLRTRSGAPGHRTAEVLFGFENLERQVDRLRQLLERRKDPVSLANAVLVDLAPEKIAIVRALDSSASASVMPEG
jgi:hypothetical protein